MIYSFVHSKKTILSSTSMAALHHPRFSGSVNPRPVSHTLLSYLDYGNSNYLNSLGLVMLFPGTFFWVFRKTIVNETLSI